ncbi:thiol-disulfide oxidoreductase DCC family protein [Pontibacter roseus]|uniref:thiol-disulfide oxidoreductase DCC family protein n=1 Tax=Pontibacter roseus TaxID=336989 RepID=UPI0003693A05|nr:DCC1-like thiol-disulfide oxidoreductase family protein [Pontibacter roseus]
MHALPDKPLLLYDGDCSFCKYWIGRWKAQTRNNVDYRPYQEMPEGFFGIPKRDFQRGVQFVSPEGVHYKNARAVFEVLELGGSSAWRWLYHRIPFANRLFELQYRLVANNRDSFFKLTRLVFRDAR